MECYAAEQMDEILNIQQLFIIFQNFRKLRI